eukprot:TRINITY_DN3610_c0_g7_i1.p1 TRINITY_DN3610_c0_g7~~TRINITY_DN3610_c0_g7_i1.p1  ORF type:complete len:405 (-),score=150.60 TRINITY_DN3610_c0_g7_i1:96-1310(-)
MATITKEMLRKRAEHNEGVLSTLEEISLHQQNIEKIENLEYFCRHLKILYLQSNIINRMENLNKLKELEYLNLAVNNIQKIENIEGCESLKKLDLTLNFVDLEDLESSITCLSKCPLINDLYLTGNPCESWGSLKDYVIARLPQLRRFNGSDVLKSERIKAVQSLKLLEKELETLVAENIKKKKQEQPKEEAYTPESRTKMYKDLMEKQQQEEEEKKQRQANDYTDDLDKYLKEPPPVYNAEGEIRQCNQGKYKFKFVNDWDDENVVFELYVPKFLDTSLINVDLNPTYVRIDVKGKITQIKFEEEVIVAKSKVQRSTTTGALQLICPKLNFDHQTKKRKEAKEEMKKEEKKLEPIRLAHLLKKGEKEEELLKEISTVSLNPKESAKKVEEKVEVDDSDVPPLE